MKQFETFGEYMFDLLFAPLKKGRKTVNQLRIFFKVMGREFDDLKAAIFRVRSEANVASCSEVMLPVPWARPGYAATGGRGRRSLSDAPVHEGGSSHSGAARGAAFSMR